jgi:starch phosphorylase
MKPKAHYRVLPNLPPPLRPLMEMAYNLCFTWKVDVRELFRRIDPELWQNLGHNPVLMLGMLEQERLEELALDQAFLAELERVNQDFRRYMERSMPAQWLDLHERGFLVAYFSMEFGLAECLPMYSGGLGVLSGDHLKSASDLNLPLVGVSLLYQEGSFSQYLSTDGWQQETYSANDFHNMPVRTSLDGNGDPVRVVLNLKGQPLLVQVWRMDVGKVTVILLDTNLQENPSHFREITSQLYVGDRERRLQQEMVLGIGGMRALRSMNLLPTVIHINEGHCAFACLERINMLRREQGLSFDAAREVTLATTVFTTHTPVAAGNEVFDQALVAEYFSDFAQELGVNIRVIQAFGRVDPQNEAEPFGMTPLALRLSAHANAVSRLHSNVSRSMWRGIWPDFPVEDVPIDYVTNGIHVPTWISAEMATLFDRYLGPDWAEDPDNRRVWDRAQGIPTAELWRTHQRCREQLVSFARRKISEQLRKRGALLPEVIRASEVLSPEAMTIGFARRFALYKRAYLLFLDQERLAGILNHPERPVQVIVAGKAHPQDNDAKALIQRIYQLSQQGPFWGRVVFLEDYDIQVARQLVAGCDVWLNTPRRPLEACGTSGMKAAANGVIHMSTLDGWWEEGYAPEFGWAIGHGEVYEDHALQDQIEARNLYDLLEREIIPLFYRRNSGGVPVDWVEKMRAGLRDLVPNFNTHRMIQQYAELYYMPCTKRFHELSRAQWKGAIRLAQWRNKLMTSWGELRVEEVTGPGENEFVAGDSFEVGARVRLGPLSPEDVSVEAYYGRLDSRGEFAQREIVMLEHVGREGQVFLFRGEIPCRETGLFGFTVRVLPSERYLENRFSLGLVTWA